MMQATLFDSAPVESIVNVATVPQRSPFRYPGGKTWLVPRVRQWLRSQKKRPSFFIEPFAGGGIISLTIAAENLAGHVVMCELDEDVASVWQTILDDNDNEWLAQQIVTFDMSLDNAKTLLAQAPTAIRERAFQTIVKNRVVRGGILAPGAGLMKGGENGRGIVSRWYPATLARRIRAISAYRDRITFIQGNGLAVMETYAERPRALFFLDPPYTAGNNGKRAGTRLYRHHTLDHEQLFANAHKLRGDFLMTYDDALFVRQLAARYEFDARLVPMKNTHHAKMHELLISRHLGCLDR